MLAISCCAVELAGVRHFGPFPLAWPCAALLAMPLFAACERPTAPVDVVYADRQLTVPAYAEGWRDVTVGSSHTCGIRLDGRLYCWGSNTSGQLGVTRARGQCFKTPESCEAAPKAVAIAGRIVQASAGARHSCAIREDGALYCWGENLKFQTGVEASSYVRLPTAVLPTARFNQVSAGATHSCAVRTNGVVYCWGEGTLGALGRGDTVSSVIPQPIVADARFEQVSAGRLRSCAIADAGVLWCWGSEWESNRGLVDVYHQRLLPHRVDGAPPLRSVSVGGSSICGVGTDGHAFCWESNVFGQLGNGTTTGTAVPTMVLADELMPTASVGAVQTCGLTTSGRALCWGNDSFGQLGIPRTGERCGELECRRLPAQVFGGLRFNSVVTGDGVHSCGVTTSSALVCWGLGNEGQLGDGWTRDRQSLPVAVLAPTS